MKSFMSLFEILLYFNMETYTLNYKHLNIYASINQTTRDVSIYS
jgi:hypothetical protein